MENVNVPFLLPYNFSEDVIPPILSKLIASKIVNIGTFTRTANATCIDGIFKFTHSSVSKIATMECKIWATVLDGGETKKILEKALLNKASMSLILCNFTVKNPEDDSALYSYCNTQSIKLLSIVRQPAKYKYKVTEYYPSLEIIDPKLYSFIFEFDVINS